MDPVEISIESSGKANLAFTSIEVLDAKKQDMGSSNLLLDFGGGGGGDENSNPVSDHNKPVPSHRIEWRNLSFEVKKDNLEFKPPVHFKFVPFQRMILQPQTGCIKSGEMTALMGPSGAGKTTLLNAITGKCDPKYVKGDINFVTNSSGKEKKLLKLSYVPQKDFLFQEFTIRETLTFACKFNAIATQENISSYEITSKVEKLAQDINLTVALDTKISECSGGQVKRVSVAIELISNPNILILDEPTSGLDSLSASLVISVLKNLLSKKYDGGGQDYIPPAVICAIHQPSIEVFNLFDQVYVLADGGKNVFSGPPSRVPEMLAMNDVIVTGTANPADFLLMVCQSKKEIKGITSEIEEFESESIVKVSTAKKETDESFENLNFFSTVGILLQRQVKMVQYNPWPIVIRSLFCITSTLGMNAMYDHTIGEHSGCYDEVFGFNQPSSEESLLERLASFNFEDTYNDSLKRMTEVLDNVGFVLISTMFIVVVHSFMTLVEIPAEIKIISKEVSNHWYSINSYISARIAVTFFVIIFHISFYAWFMMVITDQILDWERYLLITGSWILLAWISELTGFTIGVFLHTDMISAVLIQVVCMFPLILFSGFFVKSTSVPKAIKPLTYGSQMKYVFEAVMITIYGRGRCNATNEDDLTFTQTLKLSVFELIGRFMKTNNITHEISPMVSPLLGLPDHTCVAQVINGTRNLLVTNDSSSDAPVLMLPRERDFMHDYDESYNVQLNRLMKLVDKAEQQSSEFSLPLSMFGINEDDLEQCYYALGIILGVYIVLNFLALKRIVNVNF